MTDPHALIVATLREHRFERCSISEPGCFIWWGRCTGCGVESDRRTSNYGWELDMRDEERHQTEQILSLPGVAIVEVPEGMYVSVRYSRDGAIARLNRIEAEEAAANKAAEVGK